MHASIVHNTFQYLTWTWSFITWLYNIELKMNIEECRCWTISQTSMGLCTTV